MSEIFPEPVSPVEGLPALLVGKRAVIGDLHIGYELSVSGKGIYLPAQTRRYLKLLRLIRERTDAEELIILGDVKQSVGYPGIEEAREVIEFFREASRDFRITVVPGNHDGGLDRIVAHYASFALPDGVVVNEQGKRVGMLHGHARPSDEVASSDVVIMAHLHIFIKYERAKLPVWLVGGTENGGRIILMPPFNDLLPGHSFWGINENVPFFNVRYSEMGAVTLDGFYLGKIREIKGLIEVESD